MHGAEEEDRIAVPIVAIVGKGGVGKTSHRRACFS